MAKLIFGCGYLGARVARRWFDAGEELVVVTRSRPRAEGFEHHGYRAIVADVTRPETLAELPEAESALFAVGFDRAGGKSIEAVYAGGVRNVLAALPEGVRRFIYISTTGVYGPAGGEWVDERTPPDPQREGGRASLVAEQAVTDHPLGKRSIVLRLAGIYGPGRVPFLEELGADKPIAAPATGYLNLIHVDDAAAAVLAADGLPQFDDGPRVYNVSDGKPVVRSEFYAEVARRIGAMLPTFTAPAPDSPRAARALADRRIGNQLMLAELGVRLAYPDYRAGLAKILSP